MFITGYLAGSEDYYSHYRCFGKECGYDFRDNLQPADNETYNGTYSTYLFADRAIDIINKHDEDKVRLSKSPICVVQNDSYITKSVDTLKTSH